MKMNLIILSVLVAQSLCYADVKLEKIYIFLMLLALCEC